MSALQSIWQAIPVGLKRFVGYGVASGVALSLVLAMYLFWGTGYLQDRLGLVATKADITEQTRVMESAMPSAIEEAVSRYDTTLKQYLQRERELAEDTIMKPILRAIMELDKQQREMLRSMGASTMSMEQRTRAIDDQLERLVQERNASETDRLLLELLRKVEEQNGQIEELRKGVKRTQRIRM